MSHIGTINTLGSDAAYPVLPGLDEATARQYGFLGALSRLADYHVQDTGAPPTAEEMSGLAQLAAEQHGVAEADDGPLPVQTMEGSADQVDGLTADSGMPNRATDVPQGQPSVPGEGEEGDGGVGGGDDGKVALDNPDCSEIHEMCHAQCATKHLGNRSDSPLLYRRCVRECMEIHGCYNY